MSPKKLIRTWRRADSWAFVALKPGDLPANPVAERYLRSVAAIEAVGVSAKAVIAYRTATEAWPGNDLAWLGLGNALYASGELPPAQDAYQKVLEIDPNHTVALNNLSQVYADLGCRDDALEALNSALSAVDVNDPMHYYLNVTMDELRKSEPTSRYCVHE